MLEGLEILHFACAMLTVGCKEAMKAQLILSGRRQQSGEALEENEWFERRTLTTHER